MPTDLELMNIHVRALFTSDSEERLLFVNEPNNRTTTAPRLFVGRTREGCIWRFRTGLPDKLCEELNALCAAEPPLRDDFNTPPLYLESILRLLNENGPVEDVSNNLVYRFVKNELPSISLVAVTEDNPEILQNGFEKLIEELPSWQPFVALVDENRAVSVCRSVRITPEAHEAGVETLPEFRGKGFAKEVVSEWAHLVLETGAIPLYSTSFENKASQSVARKLGLRCYGVTLKIA